MPPLSDDTCGFTRSDALQCMRKYVDSDHNDRITTAELEESITKYAPAWMRALSWFVGVERVMEDCDYNEDGVLTPRDLELSTEKCFPKQENLCTFEWFCNRAKEHQ